MFKRPLALATLALLFLAACGQRERTGTADFDPNPAAKVSGKAGTGIQFASLSYEKALEKARSENKIVMIDFYTDWCGWCKKMDREVFTDPRMTAASQSIVPIRLNAEKEGEDQARLLSVDGFPTIIFVDGTGKVIQRVVGYTQADKMLRVLQDLSKNRT